MAQPTPTRVTITVGNTAPTAAITAPTAGTTWKVGDVISFSGSATDAQDGTLPASALTWELVMQHCPSNCHPHPMQSFAGVASGTFAAPDHEYPSYLELKLTVTDSGGLTNSKTLRLDPKTVQLTFQTTPGGLPSPSTAAGQGGVHPHRDRRLEPTPSAPSRRRAKGPKTYNFDLLVRRRSPDPQHRRADCGHHLHRPLSTAVIGRCRRHCCI